MRPDEVPAGHDRMVSLAVQHDRDEAMTIREARDTVRVEAIEPSTEFPGYTALGFDIEGGWLTVDVPPLEYTFRLGDRIELISSVEEPWGLVAIQINDGPRVPMHYPMEYMLRPWL